MKPATVAVRGGAESRIGRVPELTELDLRAEAARLALADAGLTMAQVDGVTSASQSPIDVSHYLGTPPPGTTGPAWAAAPS